MTDNGMQKKVSEPYLVDALSFTEAEARIIEEITPYITGEFTVSNIKRVKLAEIFPNEVGDKWYKAKLMFVTLDEKAGVEKRTPSNVLVQASNFSEALSTLMEGMKGTMADFEVALLTETPLMDVFKYKVEGEE